MNMDRAFYDVLQDRPVALQAGVLEHHAGLRPQAIDPSRIHNLLLCGLYAETDIPVQYVACARRFDCPERPGPSG
ncbi:hypothetical protein JK191_08825 [Gluconobacter sphaericus]|uniref:hypothetical protein n=1 Tax=Gluconobacter sphaericus TaxID=574987 RepID=UPI001B8AB286|nr:hypothetical protein [Gluconobacter sphaericus]MBS1097673.1 hypothetical protein [Gluconobacter sphaericus]